MNRRQGRVLLVGAVAGAWWYFRRFHTTPDTSADDNPAATDRGRLDGADGPFGSDPAGASPLAQYVASLAGINPPDPNPTPARQAQPAPIKVVTPTVNDYRAYKSWTDRQPEPKSVDYQAP